MTSGHSCTKLVQGKCATMFSNNNLSSVFVQQCFPTVQLLLKNVTDMDGPLRCSSLMLQCEEHLKMNTIINLNKSLWKPLHFNEVFHYFMAIHVLTVKSPLSNSQCFLTLPHAHCESVDVVMTLALNIKLWDSYITEASRINGSHTVQLWEISGSHDEYEDGCLHHMEAVSFSETSTIIYQTTWYNMPEDSHFHVQLCLHS
jgi:hypothetical protein